MTQNQRMKLKLEIKFEIKYYIQLCTDWYTCHESKFKFFIFPDIQVHISQCHDEYIHVPVGKEV